MIQKTKPINGTQINLQISFVCGRNKKEKAKLISKTKQTKKTKFYLEQ